MTEEQRSHRDPAIDWLRGLVMILMALDHTRDFYMGFGDPTNLTTTTPALFFTRWVTHFCAPSFIFLAGVSAALYAQRHTPKETTHFLWARGLWLLLLELTIIRFGWVPDPTYSFIPLQVIWAIAISMLCLALLSRLPLPWLLTVSLGIIVTHNLFDTVKADQLGAMSWLWHILHQRGSLILPGERKLIVLYPLIPWIGVMASGYALGALVQRPKEEAKVLLWRIGLALVGSFLLLRGLQLYGDPHPWSVQKNTLYTLMSFLNCTKYPPSLLFLSMTLGPVLLAWSWLSHKKRLFQTTLSQWLITIGRVPLFFYIAHLYLLRFPAAAISYARFGDAAFQPPPAGKAGAAGFSLGIVYIVWIIALLLLTPACRWFASLKQQRRDLWWLRYL